MRLTPKADIEQRDGNVRLAAQKRAYALQQKAVVFDHLVGANHQRPRHVDAEAEARKLGTLFLKQADPQIAATALPVYICFVM
jgi:hypothetical protein